MISVPYVDLSIANDSIRDEINQAINYTINNSSYITGPDVDRFEDRLAEYLLAEDAAAVGSGTMALVLALRACDIGPGDEVITTPLSFISTTEAIVEVGATPVFVDIDELYQLDISLIKSKVTNKTIFTDRVTIKSC
jgi:dTDP-4-amino-4,6-dideoxygalactose transaminase